MYVICIHNMLGLILARKFCRIKLQVTMEISGKKIPTCALVTDDFLSRAYVHMHWYSILCVELKPTVRLRRPVGKRRLRKNWTKCGGCVLSMPSITWAHIIHTLMSTNHSTWLLPWRQLVHITGKNLKPAMLQDWLTTRFSLQSGRPMKEKG